MTTAELQRREDPPIVKLLDQYQVDLTQALPEGMTPGRFQSIVINQVRTTPKLLECVPMTVIASVLMSAQMGLEPGAPLGLSWVIPRRNRGRMEASFQVGYQGLRQLAYRSGVVSDIEARIVYEGDTYDFTHGMGGTNWRHTPGREATTEWTDVYCVARIMGGTERFESMSRDQILAHRDRYVSKWDQPGSAWKENEPEMARKTVTAKLCRQLPMSVEFRHALAVDGATPYALVPDLAGLVALERGDDEEGDDASGES
jgi:recombination protein RecT